MKMLKEDLVFPSEFKTKVTKMINTSRITISFVCGKKYVFKDTNLGIEEPNKIVFSNNSKYLEVIVYEDTDNFYIKDLLTPISLTKLVKIINTNF